MIIELSFALVGGVNFGLEDKYNVVQGLMKKYPGATWRKIVDIKRGIGKYIIKV